MRTEIVKLLRQRKVYEDGEMFLGRIQKIKDRIKEYKENYKRIAIITHYYNI